MTETSDEAIPKGWVYKSYTDLSEYYNLVIERTNNSLYRLFLKDYVNYIFGISYIVKSDILDLNLKLYSLDSKVEDKLCDIGLIDLVQKLRYEKMRTRINIKPDATYSGRGKGNYYFGFTYQLSEKISFDIQVEGTQYRHKLNIIKEPKYNVESLKVVCNKIKESGIMFNFPDIDFLYESSRRRNVWNVYNGKSLPSVDIYDYRKIGQKVSFEELINYLNNDMKHLT